MSALSDSNGSTKIRYHSRTVATWLMMPRCSKQSPSSSGTCKTQRASAMCVCVWVCVGVCVGVCMHVCVY